MKFIFKRKYTLPFFLMIILMALCVAFYFIGPKFIQQEDKFFKEVLLISLLDSVLVVFFIFGLYRVHYYLYHDHLEIKRSLRKPLLLNYNQIKEVREIKKDKAFLFFVDRPSFKIKYERHGKIKVCRVRVASHELFKTVLQNEKNIRLTTSA